ncbi:unnamed protein product [Dibothriocephalus latus]|uniref:RRM domain-containing protein n=1 Tax=Dibothriocephalus latus TaxID=60516 RepID=A0A3P7P2U6_DIBLA|nr:unnamed protein product [Dibothriocephalus latus]
MQGNIEPKKIYLASLPKWTTECSLHEYFSQFGIVMDVSVSKVYKFCGRGFVDFRDLMSVAQVLDSQPHKLNETQITICLAEEAGSEDSG